jgi:tetratricopeptide (TPR) repeat protein
LEICEKPTAIPPAAMAEYDKAIAMLDNQISGRQKPSDRMDLLFYHRGWAKDLKGDVDGAVADYTQAIAIKPTYGAGAYSNRGDIKKARGDLAGAIADYQHAVQYAQLEEDKAKLRNVRAELKSGGKAARLEARPNEQPSNTTAATPEGIADAFVQAYSGADVDPVANLYADRVDHANDGVITDAAIKKQAQEYFTRWPTRQWTLTGPVTTTSIGGPRRKIVFSASYDASDPQTNKHASGLAIETLIVASDASGAMKIVSQKEQTSKRGSGQPGGETSADLGLNAAKAEYEHSSHDEAARVRYVTKLADMRAPLGPKIKYTHDLDARGAYIDQADAIDQELRRHPMPRNVDPRKLRQLLIGEWNSPRHTYVFRADGTNGISDEQRDKWRIEGNQLIEDGAGGTIILLSSDYFIYAEKDAVFFHSRVKE